MIRTTREPQRSVAKVPTHVASFGLLAVLAAFGLWGGDVAAQQTSENAESKSAASEGSASAWPPEYALPLRKEGSRERIGQLLNETVVDLIKLRRVTKQAHWNVTGQHFHAIHDTTADLAAVLEDKIDAIAERSLAIGVPVDARTVRVGSTSRLIDGPNGFNPDYSMARIMTMRLAKMSRLLTKDIERLGEIDLVSQDLLIGAKTIVDKYHWKFAVQTRDLNDKMEAKRAGQ
jgi:starvation-inducible DNA-binding protein